MCYETFLANSRALFKCSLFFVVFPSLRVLLWLLEMELCRHLSTGPTAIPLGVGPEKQLDDLFSQSHMQRLGSLQGWLRINMWLGGFMPHPAGNTCSSTGKMVISDSASAF